MVAIHAISGRTLALGREGENLARQVVFDISEWRASYGDGTVSLIAQRHGDAEPYPCNITVDGDTVTWPITSADTACPDYGHCELRYSVGDVLVKSEMWRTFVADALGTPQPEPPEPQKAWVDKVLEAGQAAVDASVNSPKIGNNGNWWTWDFEAGAYVDTGVAASGGGSGSVSSVNGATGAVELTAEDVGAVPAPATAQVGQTIVVKAVDEDGKPTEWETRGWTGIGEITLGGTEFSISAYSDGVVTITPENGVYPPANKNTVLRKPDYSAYINVRFIATETEGRYTMVNLDGIVYAPSDDLTQYVVDVPNARTLSFANIPELTYFKARITTPMLVSHASRSTIQSNYAPFNLLDGNYADLAGGAFEAVFETEESPIPGKIYSKVSLRKAKPYHKALMDGIFLVNQPETPSSILFKHYNDLFTIGTKVELWGRN